MIKVINEDFVIKSKGMFSFEVDVYGDLDLLDGFEIDLII